MGWNGVKVGVIVSGTAYGIISRGNGLVNNDVDHDHDHDMTMTTTKTAAARLAGKGENNVEARGAASKADLSGALC
jgi:hypothetical protein